MAGTVGRYAANKLLNDELKKYAKKDVSGDNDPFYFYVEDPKKPGKVKKLKKKAPSYIPEHDREILDTYRRRAFRLDVGLFSLCGIRFGWDSVIGIIPFAGDAVGVALALLLVQRAMKVTGGLPQTILIRMLINVALDFAVGLVPFVGDLADAVFKCNTRNVRLLEKHLDQKYKPQTVEPEPRGLSERERRRRAQNRKSGVYPLGELPPATEPEAFEDEDFPDHGREQRQQTQQQPAAPAAKPRGWRSLFDPPPAYQPPDVEMAEASNPGASSTRR